MVEPDEAATSELPANAHAAVASASVVLIVVVRVGTEGVRE